MNRRSSRLLVLLFLVGCAAPKPAVPARVVILHTNDIHGRVHPTKGKGGLSALSAMVKRIRAEEEAKGAKVILVDCGDFFQGTLEGDLPKGRLLIEIMNEIGYDAVCLGNHEFDKGKDVVRELAGIAEFPFLGANIIDEETGRTPDYIKDRLTIHGVPFVGLITHHTPLITVAEATKGLRFEDPRRTLKRYPDHVVLSHCGHEMEAELTGRFVIGGHSHQRISRPGYQQAGAWARWLGYVALGKNPEQKLLTVGTENDPAVDAIIRKYAPEIDRMKNRVVGELAHDMPRSGGPKSSPLGNYLTDLMRRTAKADFAFHNRGGIRTSMSKGTVKFTNVYEVSPFGNTIVAMDMTGAQILELIEASLTGSAMRILEISGFEFTFNPRGPPGKRISQHPFDPEKTYRIATNSFLAGGGDGHSLFKNGTNRVDTRVDLMQAHLDDLKTMRPLRYEHRNRIHVKPQ